jgi:hypothetical protein
MKTKKILLAAITIIMGISFITTSTWAGSKQRHRWEGVAIGVGAAVVGSAIINSYARGPHAAPPVSVSVNYVEYDRPSGHHRDHYRPHKPYRCCERRSHKPCCRKHYRHHKNIHKGHGRSHRHGRHCDH